MIDNMRLKNLTPMQDINRKIAGIYYCQKCGGKDCEKCGGLGLKKYCKNYDCSEYGCCGGNNCVPSYEEIKNVLLND
jgi:hypothetical protein